MHKIKNPNPLNFFDLRQVRFPPEHFEYVNLSMKYNLLDSISKWIYENQKGKYFVGKSIELDANNQINVMLKVGFEDHKELSYFTLACPHLRY